MNETVIQQALDSLEAKATMHRFPSGEGDLVIRHWPGPVGAEPVMLLHGGSGSWMHWYRNIEPLRQQLDVYAIDLPGLGDSAMAGPESSADAAAEMTLAGILGAINDRRFHMVAFSWGCTVTAMLMRQLSEQVKSVLLTGPAAMGDIPRRQHMKPLIKRTADMTRQQVLAAQRENVARLMIHDPDGIDDMAVMIQDLNTARARFSSPQYARSLLVLDGLRDTVVPLFVLYGEFDQPAYPGLAERRQLIAEVRPDARFEVIPGAGHWLQYEASDIYNSRCLDWILGHR